MNHPLLLAASLALGAQVAWAQSAQSAQAPAAPAPATTEAAQPPAAAQRKDHNCLKYTGTRIHLEEGRCAMGAGTVITREDLQRTGRTNVGDAVEALVPSVRVSQPRVAGANR